MNKKSNKVGTVTSFNKSIPQEHRLTIFGRFGTLIIVLEIIFWSSFQPVVDAKKHYKLNIICDIYYTLTSLQRKV